MKDHVILQDRQGSRWLNFRRPRRVVVANRWVEVPEKLAEVEREVNVRGLYAAGFITYEAAPAFDPALVVRPPAGLPLLWFGRRPSYRA